MCVIARILTATAVIHLGLFQDLSAPVHLDLSSQFFVHVLSWDAGPGSPDRVHYSVGVRALNGGALGVKECEDVTFPLRCNLTDALSDPDDTYYVCVTAALGRRSSKPSCCPPFRPTWNTTYEPPLLTVTACNRSLCVHLRAPAEKLHSVYSSFSSHYRLRVSGDDTLQFEVDTEGLNPVTLPDLAPGRRYCVSVSVIVPHLSAPSRPVCASVPPRSNLSDVLISLTLCVLLLLLVLCALRYVCRRCGLKPDLPPGLRLVANTDKVILVAADESFSKLCEERMKTSREEEEEEEEGVKRAPLKAHYLNPHGSPLTVLPSSGSALTLTPDTSLGCCSDAPGAPLLVFDPDPASPELPDAAGAPHSFTCVFPSHAEDESAADVNLFSVTLGGASERAGDAEDPQDLLLTWVCDAQSHDLLRSTQSSAAEEEEEDEGYLSRN